MRDDNKMFKSAWCKCCRKIVKFRQHEDYKDRWVCTTQGCYNWERKKDLKEEPKNRMWV